MQFNPTKSIFSPTFRIFSLKFLVRQDAFLVRQEMEPLKIGALFFPRLKIQDCRLKN
jgi:hypothetical protein